MKIDLSAVETDILAGLKDFQRATVERVLDRYKAGQSRVLVADEVGLGKTLVAKGIVAKTARWHREEKGDKLFKVVYVCSNQGIATQNLQKLVITKDIHDITVDGLGDTRLSMQHLKIFQQENDPAVLERYIQLIPLTPSTSFSITNGTGSVRERALMFAILRRMELFTSFLYELEVMMADFAVVNWAYYARIYEQAVQSCDNGSNGEYTRSMMASLLPVFAESGLGDRLIEQCLLIRKNKMRRIASATGPIGELRIAFAKISVDRLEPDLVIMDEFQRFRFLIDEGDSDSEMGMLARRFLSGSNTKVLLLSATPYKLYSTLEEIDEARSDEHYTEFLQVMDFLFDSEERKTSFHTIWNNFTVQLREMDGKNLTVLEVKKAAEGKMFEGICRTERNAVITTGGFIDDDSVKKPLNIDEGDIRSYIQAKRILQELDLGISVPVDYVKSAPFLLSYLDHYKLKERVRDSIKSNHDLVSALNTPDRRKALWVRRVDVDNYRELPSANARLRKLKEIALEAGSELMLWVPPSLPYYPMQGVYKGKKHFSKVLVFSAWEMVPRMIATQLSYETERRTVGKLIAYTGEKKNVNYFAKARYPYPRLRFRADEGADTMSLFSLIYPSRALADVYRPIDCLNRRLPLKAIENEIARALKEKTKLLQVAEQADGRNDNRWYYLAPMLLDGREDALAWVDEVTKLGSIDDDEGSKGGKMFGQHLQALREELLSGEPLGRQPDDLFEVLAGMAIGSPAVCATRCNGGIKRLATQFARMMLNKFNAPEATAAVELIYGKRNDNAHWKNVLQYLCDGCFQSVLDEYAHMLTESYNLREAPNRYELLNSLLLESAAIRSAQYPVDTYTAFTGRIVHREQKEKTMRMRSHFAVGFYQGENTKGNLNRKESVRNAFNSPFEPFVLATTSIGQEGLDFHYYCRKIMHWNLPANPIDLEQREGRINRFKCLAIRQSLAEKFADLQFRHNVWDELFSFAKEDCRQSGSSDLIPFWCLSDGQAVKIERIIPLYPLSRDVGAYERLIKILSLYRLTLGQPRQEEFLEHVMQSNLPEQVLKELFINLSPHYRKFGVPELSDEP